MYCFIPLLIRQMLVLALAITGIILRNHEYLENISLLEYIGDQLTMLSPLDVIVFIRLGFVTLQRQV